MGNDTGFYYSVRPGDTLSGIARRYGVANWRTIYNDEKNAGFRAKNPNPDRIFPGDRVWVPGVRPNRAARRSGRRSEFVTRITDVSLVRLSFESDHHVLLKNDTDWTKNGQKFTKPDWEPGKSHPISHTKAQTVAVKAEFQVRSRNNAGIKGEIQGLGKRDDMRFKGSIKPSNEPVSMTAKSPLPDRVEKLSGLKVDWKVHPARGTYDAGTSGPHTIYLTMDDPIDEGEAEDGPTLQRMALAVAWVGATGTNDPMSIIEYLFGKFPIYVLDFHHLPEDLKEYLKWHPGKKRELQVAGFSAYKEDNLGGAWLLAEYEKYGGECQAIVRLIRGIKNQVGCPGEAEVKYVNVEYVINKDGSVNEDWPYESVIEDKGTRCSGPDPKKKYALVDGAVKVGQLYGDADHVGWNNYEAYLKFSVKEPTGKTRIGWFGGGVGKRGEVDKDDREAVEDLERNLLFVFWGLAEYESVKVGTAWKRKVTAVWSYRR